MNEYIRKHAILFWVCSLGLPWCAFLGQIGKFLPGPHGWGRMATHVADIAPFLLATLFLMVVPGMLLGLISGLIKKKRPIFVFLSLICFANALFAFVANVGSYCVQQSMLILTTKIGHGIIEALETYKGDYGTYPDSVESLVPDYLKTIPRTPLSCSPKFYYWRTESAETGGYTLSVPIPYALFIRNEDLFYYPNQTYSPDPFIERIGTWAYQHGIAS